MPELAALAGEASCIALREAVTGNLESKGDRDEAVRGAMRNLFDAIVTQSEDAVKEQVTALVERLRGAGTVQAEPSDSADAFAPSAAALALRLNEQFPLDVGVFAPFILNVLRLQPGEGVFLAANEPHAYLAGDCVECMACSDNVVRAGLTPKLKDKDTLVKMLTYSTGAPVIDSGSSLGPGLRRFAPPVPEFEILRVEVRPGASHGSASGGGGGGGEDSPGTGIIDASLGESGTAGAGSATGSGSGCSEDVETFAVGETTLPVVPSGAIVLVLEGEGEMRATAAADGVEAFAAAEGLGAQMAGEWGAVSRG